MIQFYTYTDTLGFFVCVFLVNGQKASKQLITNDVNGSPVNLLFSYHQEWNLNTYAFKITFTQP